MPPGRRRSSAGKYLLDNILGAPPPAPPPNVSALEESDQAGHPLASMRDRMAAHRKNAACAVCHARIDPLGFALENFDAIGKWRITDGTSAIDASGALPDGTTFGGPGEFRQALLQRREQFVQNFTERLLTYALGRAVQHPRYANRARGHARRGVERLPLVVADTRYRRKPAVSDEKGGRG